MIIVFPLSLVAQVTDDMYSVKDGAVVVEKVIPFSIPQQQASDAVKRYLVTNLKDSNQTLKVADVDYFVAKILTPQLTHHVMGSWYTVGEVTIEVKFKEDRTKVSLQCNNIRNENVQGTNCMSYSPLEASPLAKHDAMKVNITKKAADDTFNNLVMYMAYIVEEINASVKNAKVEDDW